MSTDELEQKRICHFCIEEPFLSGIVKKEGKRRKCSYCDMTNRTVSVKELADRTQEVFDQFYQRTPEDPDDYQYALMRDSESDYEWERNGTLITDLIEEDVEIPREAAEDVQKILMDRFSSNNLDEIGEETEFSEESQYELKGVESKAWQEKWHDFENSLKTQSRYFNKVGQENLEGIFKDLNKLKSISGDPIMVVGPSQKIKAVYRARVFLSDESLRIALENIVEHLGPPNSQFAVAGRMNAAGISVFYGATEERTALSEVRPPVGSRVVVAKFNFIRNLRLLDLVKLKDIEVDGSLFDKSHADLLSRLQFMRELCDKMTIPVMPGEEDLKYLVTQAIADYLSMEEDINIDGIMFPSIQTESGFNIVLFHKCSRVSDRDVPAGTETSVQLWHYDDEADERYPWYVITETTSALTDVKNDYYVEKDSRKPTLIIDEASINIHSIQAVQFTSEFQKVTIFRNDQKELEELEKLFKL